MAVLIRPVAPGDATAIAAIWNPVIRETTVIFHTQERDAAAVAAYVAQRRAAGREFWVAAEGAAVLGFASYDQFRTGNGYAHAMEHTVILAPEAQGRGLGRALMAAVEAHAAAGGAHVMIAAIDAANRAGRAFHAALGYREVGHLPETGRKFGRWLDLVLMQKSLASEEME
ncbi:MAG: N-acetyltransferase [Rhodobacteraceae bacterium]|nr:N-acetyltransferase [Paracoccaceae bacterium]